MKKKICILAMAILIFSAAGAYSFGIGIQFNGNASDVFSPGIAISFCPSKMAHLSFNWNFAEDLNIIGLTADFMAFNPKILSFSHGSLNFLFGAGLYGNLVFSSEEVDLNFGVRFPVGLNLFLAGEVFEIFAHVAPSIGLRFYPNFGADKIFFPIAVGIRLWIGRS
ncbi:hypothetical protein K7I13_00250 [Brucepastera parasyntrophica]|uniref:hypothetical protein n=1 Tax=Brucepastera parasyntrophica TaxID=2880008 RepID=UPI00210D0558|nr:hypothetical protein [Brucepastera parasyntrophica]ULQ59830.1 hypothetical protein K7I13_00250 [Brucepastera parasyntrophica]